MNATRSCGLLRPENVGNPDVASNEMNECEASDRARLLRGFTNTTHRSRSSHDVPDHSFLQHLLEMTLAMVVGMMASAAIFLTPVGMTAEEALRQHAVLFVVVQALGMSAAMVGWMRYRGHAWRGCSEMAAAMVVAAVPLILLRLTGVISGPICGVYCLASVIAMVLVMLYRRGDYRAAPTAVPGS
jgi:cation transport ATPase